MKLFFAILLFVPLLVAQPFDLQAEINALTPGAVLTVPPGVYAGTFVADASCTPAAPCRIEAAGAVIDGGLRINGSDTAWYGLEVRNTSWSTRVLTQTATQPIGIEIFGARTKIVNCAIHDTNGGVYAWSTAVDAEIAGCRIQNVGYRLGTTGHGHAFYLQNDAGTKYIHDNIILPGYSGYGIHAYGQAGKLEGFDFARNVHVESVWLLGGGQPVDRATLDSNIASGAYLDLGYWGVGNNQAITVTNNLFSSTLLVSGFQRVTMRGNTFARMSDQARLKEPAGHAPYAWDTNTYLCKYTTCPIQFTRGTATMDAPAWQVQSGLDAQSGFAYGASLNRVTIWPNADDPARATVTILNGSGAASIPAPLAGRYVNAQNVAESITLAKGAALPMTGWTVAAPYGASAPLKSSTFPQFGVFLVEAR